MEENRLPTIRELRSITGLSQARFAETYGIPKRTIENWEGGQRQAPDYLIRLLARAIKEDFPATLTWSGFEADLSGDVPVFKPKLTKE